ncbi:MAG: hydrogen peroxide-inducible genes activator [Pseudomonadota bacterium]
MLHLPTLRQLQFLCALADHGSFSRAAEACLVAQPTLSAAIKEVETTVGAVLVERGARGTRLTKAGEAAVERARRVLAETEELVAVTRGAAAPLTGPFRLGAIPTIAPFVLPGLMTALQTDYPDLKLYLREEKTGNLLDGLRNRTLDAAIIALPWPTPGIETETVADDPFLLALPQGHRFIDNPPVTPRDLEGETMLLLEEGHCLRGHALSVCSMPGIDRLDDLSATSLQTMIQMVGGGIGISLVPELAARSNITAGTGVTLREFRGEKVGRSICLSWRSGSSRESEALLIAQMARERLKGKP